MQKFQGQIVSKLPQTETSVFAVMTKLAEEHHAINLAQGFPDFEISQELIGLVNKYMLEGRNQYAPMPGVPWLRKNIVKKVKEAYNADYDPETEITITAGATQAIFNVVTAFIREGDEVILFEPAYDSYGPAVKVNKGMIKYSTLVAPDYHIDWEQTYRLVSNRTRMVIINTPHNPTGSVLKEDDLLKLEKLVIANDLIVLSDEVYEHLVFDGVSHESVCKYPALASRSFMIGSFGKTFHATGWKVGFTLAPENLMKEFRKTHQFMVFACNTPIQWAIAEFLENPANYLGLPYFYQQKRDLFLDLIKDSRFKLIPSSGTYFQCANFREISDESEWDFCARITKEHGVAAIPLSPFYNKGTDEGMIRFCFAKKEETLRKAAEILCRM